MIKDSIKQLVKKEMEQANVDIDIEYCKKNGIKYDNHEVDSSTIQLFDPKTNKAAFEFVTKSR